MQTRRLRGVNYEAAVVMQDAVESGRPYYFKEGGERFVAVLHAIDPLGQGDVEVRFEPIEGEWVTR